MTGHDLHASDIGLAVALDLANVALEAGGPPAVREVFAAAPVSVTSIDDAQAEHLLGLAQRSAQVAALMASGARDDLDRAAELVNDLLDRSPAQLHLTRDPQGWTLHHHRPDAPLERAWSAVVAGAFARVIGDRRASRVGSCDAADCGRFFYDMSKNRSRRYCSLACQNRTKAATYRSRRVS
ncbi:MAG: CGNR zinc finger domain-containing protein [Actinomycetota bacterium]